MQEPYTLSGQKDISAEPLADIFPENRIEIVYKMQDVFDTGENTE